MAARTHRREIKVHGVPKPIQVEITDEGAALWIKGNKKKLHISWFQIVAAATTPSNVPSYLMGRPLEFLTKQAGK
jgi:hypothetical protein